MKCRKILKELKQRWKEERPTLTPHQMLFLKMGLQVVESWEVLRFSHSFGVTAAC